MEHLGEVDQRGLGRPIRRRLRQPAVTGDAADQRQRSAALREQGRQHCGDAAHGADEVDVDGFAHGVGAELPGAQRAIGAGVEHDEVDAAPVGKKRVAGASEGISVGEVERQGEAVIPRKLRRQPCGSGGDCVGRDTRRVAGRAHCAQLVSAPRRQRQAGAAARELERERLADARRGTDDPHPPAGPIVDRRVERTEQALQHAGAKAHCGVRLTKLSVTSPSRNPNLLISERLSMTLSSIRNIQSSKSTLYTLPSTGSAST